MQVTVGTAGEASDTELATRMGRVVDAYAEGAGFSGTVLVSRHGTIVFARSHGQADAGWAIPNAVDTRFRIASMTKPFTALAVLRLHEKGLLDIDKPLRDLVPGTDPRITPRQLLLHRSGLSRDPTDLSDKGAESRFMLSEIVDLATRSPLAFEPGTDFAYSNLGYSLLAAAIESADGQPYAQALQQLVTGPLSLNHTTSEPSTRPLARLARGYVALPDGIADAPFEDKSHVIGAGSLTSTAGDLIRFLEALQDDALLPALTRRLFLEQAAKNRTLGMVTWEYKVAEASPLQPRGGRVVMHAGSCPGYESAFGRFLDHGVSIVVLSNRSPFPVSSLFNALGNAALGFDATPNLHSDMPYFREAIARGPDAFLASGGGTRIDAPDERTTNRMGYNLLGVGRTADAISLFRLNTLLHPDSANAHDSLGEAYLAAGQCDLALASYRRERLLAPASPSALRAIRLIEGGSKACDQRRGRTPD